MIRKLMQLLQPEEKRLLLDGGSQVSRYQHSYQQSLHTHSEIKLETILREYQRVGSSLHRGADSDEVITSAFLYSCNRLPDCLPVVDDSIVASSIQAIEGCGLAEDITSWTQVFAEKRRRMAFFDGKSRLILLVTSLSDLDDVIPGLCAYQIEWNKMHRRLAADGLAAELASGRIKASDAHPRLRHALGLNRADFDALKQLWGQDWDSKMAAISAAPKDFRVRILPLLEDDFRGLSRQWWEAVLKKFAGRDIANRPVYVVTSNNHSLVNLVLGFAQRHQDRIREFARENCDDEFRRTMRRLEVEDTLTCRNLLYLAQTDLLAQDPDLDRAKAEMEAASGILRTSPLPPLLAEAQLIELGKLDSRTLDPRLKLRDAGKLAQSDALILNTDYPLGFAAYHLLETAAEHLKNWRGLFILGKSAAMIGRLGDILLPSQVRDVHSRRLYRFDNCFSARNLAPYLCDCAVFDDQRSLTVHGTFLHGWETVRELHRADFTVIEMEAGPCLAAVQNICGASRDRGQEAHRLRLPPDFHLGILHYTSDTPYNVRASLLSRPLGLTGLEATYACSLAIMQFIIDRQCGKGSPEF